jgi:hypothetical protein
MTIKEIMREDFKDSLYNPLLSKYVEWFDILILEDGDKIEVNLTAGKLDDGLYILERKGATLYFYRAGHFNKILLLNNDGIFSYTPNQFMKIRGMSGAVIHTKKYPRFFAKN